MANHGICDQSRMHRWAHLVRALTASQRAAPVGTGCSSHARGVAAPKSAELVRAATSRTLAMLHGSRRSRRRPCRPC
eukprot:7377532-Prymnesium_polylepis.1